jgi:hypothetical protein
MAKNPIFPKKSDFFLHQRQPLLNFVADYLCTGTYLSRFSLITRFIHDKPSNIRC